LHGHRFQNACALVWTLVMSPRVTLTDKARRGAAVALPQRLALPLRCHHGRPRSISGDDSRSRPDRCPERPRAKGVSDATDWSTEGAELYTTAGTSFLARFDGDSSNRALVGEVELSSRSRCQLQEHPRLLNLTLAPCQPPPRSLLPRVHPPPRSPLPRSRHQCSSLASPTTSSGTATRARPLPPRPGWNCPRRNAPGRRSLRSCTICSVGDRGGIEVGAQAAEADHLMTDHADEAVDHRVVQNRVRPVARSVLEQGSPLEKLGGETRFPVDGVVVKQGYRCTASGPNPKGDDVEVAKCCMDTGSRTLVHLSGHL
jgi:hypothetical protein